MWLSIRRCMMSLFIGFVPRWSHAQVPRAAVIGPGVQIQARGRDAGMPEECLHEMNRSTAIEAGADDHGFNPAVDGAGIEPAARSFSAAPVAFRCRLRP